MAMAALLLGGLCGFPQTASGLKPGVVLRNETVSLGFDEQYALISLADPVTGHEFIQSLPEHPILWALELETPEGTPLRINSAMESKRHLKRAAKGSEVSFTWSDIIAEGKPVGISVSVTVTLPKDGDRSFWRIAVDNTGSYKLQHVQFPYLSGISREGQPSAAIPRHNWGEMENAVKYTRGSYPSSIWPMQFLAMLEKESGLYLAYEDPTASFKFFDLKPGEFFTFTHFAENPTEAGNDFASPGPVAIGVCGNDWWKAAKMFRSWAIRQKWASRGPLTKESTIPEIGKQVGIWFNEGLNAEDAEPQKEALRAAAEFFKVPVASQLYTWHRSAFDTAYPEYFPARPAFKPLIEGVKDLNILITPYVNGRLQDVNVPSAKEATPAMVKTRAGKTYTEDYQSGATLAVMCPATEYWQNTMFRTAKTLVDDYRVNGIYYDQIAAAEPVMCFDPSHGHPLGGGSHWVDGYRKMLSRVKELKAPGGQPLFISSENNTDCYMDTVDAFLTWTPRHPNEIPLLTAVYNGYTLYFGSNAQVEDGDFASYAMYVGRDILWGTQPGWMGIDVQSDRAEYLRKWAQLRHAGKKFFQFGELVGELTPLAAPGKVKGRWRNIHRVENIFYDIEIDAVMSSVWKSPEGTLGVVIANFSGEEKTFAYKLKPSRYGVKLPEEGRWKANTIAFAGSQSLEVNEGEEIAREEKLKPWEVRMFELTPTGKAKRQGSNESQAQ